MISYVLVNVSRATCRHLLLCLPRPKKTVSSPQFNNFLFNIRTRLASTVQFAYCRHIALRLLAGFITRAIVCLHSSVVSVTTAKLAHVIVIVRKVRALLLRSIKGTWKTTTVCSSMLIFWFPCARCNARVSGCKGCPIRNP